MRWLITGLCVVAVAALPASASANTEGEAASAGPIVIGYIPQHLQQRVPGRQYKHQASEPLPRESALHEARLRVKRTRAGLISMAALTAAGGVMIGAGLAAAARRPLEPSGSLSSIQFHPGDWAAAAGGLFAIAGGIGMVVTGPLLGVRKRQLRKIEPRMPPSEHPKPTEVGVD
jgi:hypothetical protein